MLLYTSFSHVPYIATLKMEAAYLAELLLNICQTLRDSKLLIHHEFEPMEPHLSCPTAVCCEANRRRYRRVKASVLLRKHLYPRVSVEFYYVKYNRCFIFLTSCSLRLRLRQILDELHWFVNR